MDYLNPCVDQNLLLDLDYNQTQPNQQHDVADDIVVPNGAENRANPDKKIWLTS